MYTCQYAVVLKSLESRSNSNNRNETIKIILQISNVLMKSRNGTFAIDFNVVVQDKKMCKMYWQKTEWVIGMIISCLIIVLYILQCVKLYYSDKYYVLTIRNKHLQLDPCTCVGLFVYVTLRMINAIFIEFRFLFLHFGHTIVQYRSHVSFLSVEYNIAGSILLSFLGWIFLYIPYSYHLLRIINAAINQNSLCIFK
ncbi:hypothetical protein RFI_05999 [Reticulomyxa filosa]|uniref:Uncharacterized protein n=1 Tax=Reticulomyxa filosa TaxID=46433 RepID=X6P0R1_RETFI|nr:hypothetical protein RFI_05999 [Reticulomyxa filosa]|eukprot:ETO31122.1 hypothetical protein RFI_05999 [Reticulomyxa filosa]